MAANLSATLSLNTSPFTAAMGKIRGIMAASAGKLSGMWATIAGAVTGSAAAIGFKNALDLGGTLDDLSTQTGETAGTLQVLRQAFALSGMAADDAGPAVARMQKAIAEGSDAFSEFGVSVEDLKGKSVTEQFKTVGDAIMRIPDPAERAAAAMGVFGKSGAKMLTMFSDGEIMSKAADQVGTQAEILNRNAAAFAECGDKLEVAGLKASGFFVGVADKVVPVLSPLLDKFNSLDLAKYGQIMGDSFALILQMFSDGNVGTIVGRTLQIQFAKAAGYLLGALAGAGNLLAGAVFAAMRGGVELLSSVTKAEFWKGVLNAWMGIAAAFSAALLRGMAALLDKLREVPLIGEKIGYAGDSLRERAVEVTANGGAQRDEAKADFGKLAEQVAAKFGSVMNQAQASAAQAFKDGQQLIDTSAWQRELQTAWGDVTKAVQTKQDGPAPEGAAPGSGLGEDEVGVYGKKQGVADADRRLALGGSFALNGGNPMQKVAQLAERQLTELKAQTGILQRLEERARPSTKPGATTAVFAR